MLTEILIVLALILANGALALSELAVVSARPARLRAMEAGGSRGAAQALRLAEEPGRFLSTVQIGITLVGILAGAFSGARLGSRFSDWLLAQGFSATVSDALGVGTVVVAITYLSLIIGELVPKRIALRDPEGIASRVAPAMALLSRVAAPVVWFLDVSGRIVLRLLGQGGVSDRAVTDEEIRSLLAEAHAAGVIEPEETRMMAGVMRLADRSARGIMTPRHEVVTVDAGAPPKTVLARFRDTPHSRIPVEDGPGGEILGVLFARDLLDALGRGQPADPRALMREVPLVSDRVDALDVLRVLRSGQDHIVLVYDEYGDFEGIVTPGDILGAITGGFEAEAGEEPALTRRPDGSLLIAGWMPADEARDALGIALPEGAGFDTVAGLVLHTMQSLPQQGDTVEIGGWRFEVVDLDGRRIDKLLVSRVG